MNIIFEILQTASAKGKQEKKEIERSRTVRLKSQKPARHVSAWTSIETVGKYNDDNEIRNGLVQRRNVTRWKVGKTRRKRSYESGPSAKIISKLFENWVTKIWAPFLGHSSMRVVYQYPMLWRSSTCYINPTYICGAWYILRTNASWNIKCIILRLGGCDPFRGGFSFSFLPHPVFLSLSYNRIRYLLIISLFRLSKSLSSRIPFWDSESGLTATCRRGMICYDMKTEHSDCVKPRSSSGLWFQVLPRSHHQVSFPPWA